LLIPSCKLPLHEIGYIALQPACKLLLVMSNGRRWADVWGKGCFVSLTFTVAVFKPKY